MGSLKKNCAVHNHWVIWWRYRLMIIWGTAKTVLPEPSPEQVMSVGSNELCACFI
jgi:hypothetical protein